MLMGHEIYISGAPCPMLHERHLLGPYRQRTANSLQDSTRIGFDDEYQYEDFAKPSAKADDQHRPVPAGIGQTDYDAWTPGRTSTLLMECTP